jgi:glycosyltransferase involved in cell wall biosynthesis
MDMSTHTPRVSIGLPVRNSTDGLERTARSVLAQTFEDLELVISDNASTDGTEEVARQLERSDSRVRYQRQSENIGLLNNFQWVLGRAQGRYVRWISHDDTLEPDYLTRALERFEADDRLILVTTQQMFTYPDGTPHTAAYDGTALGSPRPIERLGEMLRLLNDDHLLMDPLYGLMRREVVSVIPRRNMLREDQVFAAKLALAGPWAHVPEILAHRGWADQRRSDISRLLEVPRWRSRVAILLQCRELAAFLHRAPLTAPERREGHALVARYYLTSARRRAERRARRLADLAGSGQPRWAVGR